MFKNYLTVAIRNLMRHKAYSFINVFGLAIGMACCMLILLLVQYELSYDQHHINKDRIYRISTLWTLPQSGETIEGVIGPYRLASGLQEAFPELALVRFHRRTITIQKNDERLRESRFFLAEPNVFDVFTFPLIKGNPTTALQDPTSVVLSQAMAQKYFGNADPMGQTLKLRGDRQLTVTGILDDIPENVHFHFDFLGSMNAAPALFNRIQLENWSETSVYTYALLPAKASLQDLVSSLETLIKKHRGDKDFARYNIQFKPMSITDIHLHSQASLELETNGNIIYVYAFSAIAFFILLIACINFMNLTTARSANRAREVGLRKAVGAFRFQLIRQFLGESVLLSTLAMALSIALVELTLPAFNTFIDKNLTVNYVGNPTTTFFFFGLTLFVGVISGTYPALFLSRFEPVTILKGIQKTGKRSGLLRKALVIFQFAISIFLIVVTAVIADQLNFTRTLSLGYDKDHVMVISNLPRSLRRDDANTLKTLLTQNPNIQYAGLTSRIPSGQLGSNIGTRPEGFARDQAPTMQTVWVGFDFFETLNLSFVAGRSFSKTTPADGTSGFVLNEAACRTLGWTPQEAIGKGFGSDYIDDFDQGQWQEKNGTVIGVVRDVYFESLHEKIKPMVYFIQPYMSSYLLVKIAPNHLGETLAHVRNTWQTLYPDRPIQSNFLDERFDRLYRAEEKQAQLFGIFATLAIFIGCLGLLGLAAFMSEKRTKEFGIRKVLGASAPNLMGLLSSEFIKLVFWANFFAWPLAYWAMDQWLTNFAYRTDLHPSTFILSSMLALAIALSTISYQAIKAAHTNPVDALRDE